MADEVISGGDLQSLSKAVDLDPLAPDVQAFLESLELDQDEREAVIEVLKSRRLRVDYISALPKLPPQFVGWGWRCSEWSFPG